MSRLEFDTFVLPENALSYFAELKKAEHERPISQLKIPYVDKRHTLNPFFVAPHHIFHNVYNPLREDIIVNNPRLAICVVIASMGRPEALSRWISHLDRQSYMPQLMIWSVSSENDLPAHWETVVSDTLKVIVSPPGSCAQRNAALDVIPAQIDLVAFFDDDYIPSSQCLSGITKFFTEFPDAVGATGLLLADGINGPGISLNEAFARIDAFDRINDLTRKSISRVRTGLYGCNMAYRASKIARTRFDEHLPLYGWQEDIDFAYRVSGGRELYWTNAFAGVHQGTKQSRTGGKRLGYSQIANPIYLNKKGTMKLGFIVSLMARNMLANHIKALKPEPWVDRKGRAMGNWLAIRDLARGRLDPRRILDL